MLRLFGSGDIKHRVRAWFEGHGDLAGMRVVDVPAGGGSISRLLLDLGARVDALDLYPDLCTAEGVDCRRADLRERLPLEDEVADIVLFQEAIEHLEDPLHALRELNRVLRPGGTLLLTTPNVSNLRAKLSYLLVESDLYNRLPANELDAVWYGKGDSVYFGHLFLIGIQRLRVLAKLAGLRIVRVVPVKASRSSLLLGVLLPLIVPANLFAWWRSLNRKGDLPREARRTVYGESLRLNLHPTVLFGKHLFLELEKTIDAEQVVPAVYKDPATIG